MPYRVLYLLQSTQHLFFEVKHLDVASDAPPHELYCWLHHEVASNRLVALDFEAMQSSPPFELRQFRQGTLRFSNIEGVFHAAASPQVLALRRDFLLELPPHVAEQLAQLLAGS